MASTRVLVRVHPHAAWSLVKSSASIDDFKSVVESRQCNACECHAHSGSRPYRVSSPRQQAGVRIRMGSISNWVLPVECTPLSAGSYRPRLRRQQQQQQQARGKGGGALGCVMEDTTRVKSGAELREEYFLAAKTGQERGLPEGSFLNDNVTDGPMVDITFEPFGDTVIAPEGSSLLKAAVEAGALTIDNRFCLTGQCDVCCVEVDGEDVIRSCMKPVPSGNSKITVMILDSDAAWDAMSV